MRHTLEYRGVPIATLTLAPGRASPQRCPVAPLPSAAILAGPAAAARTASATHGLDGGAAPTPEPADEARRRAWIGAGVRYAGVTGFAVDWRAALALSPDLTLRDGYGALVAAEHLDLVLAGDAPTPMAVVIHWRAALAPIPARLPTPGPGIDAHRPWAAI